MNRPILVLATVGLLAVLGIGVVTVGSRPSTTSPTPAPTAPTAVEASALPAIAVADYTSRRDQICATASAQTEPGEGQTRPAVQR